MLDYNIEAQVEPERQFIHGRARLLVRVRAGATNTLTLRLAEPLVVTNIVSLEFGRLLHLRVRNQNSIVINLPTTLTRDSDITLVITYSGRLPSQDVDREALQTRSQGQDELPMFQGEPSYLLSNRSYWYPQNTVSDYATATLRITVPPGYSAVGSGQPAGAASEVTLRDLLTVPTGKAFVFQATDPLRYLAFVVSRFTKVAETTLGVPDVEGHPSRERTRDTMTLAMEANPRLLGRARDMIAPAEDIVRFYASMIGDAPYASATVALVESDLPGGHSPGYFAVVNSPLPHDHDDVAQRSRRLHGLPRFLPRPRARAPVVGAGGRLEELPRAVDQRGVRAVLRGALRAEDARRRDLRQHAAPVPPLVADRIGRGSGSPRLPPRPHQGATAASSARWSTTRARRCCTCSGGWLGDEVFFNALRRFYDEQKFRKAGTDDLRRAFEEESGKSLERFFERWIYNSGLPLLRYGTTVEGSEVVVRFEQLTADLFDVPVTVTVTYTNGRTQEFVVPVTDKQVEHRFRAEAPVRQVQVNRDHAALAQFEEAESVNAQSEAPGNCLARSQPVMSDTCARAALD